MLTQIGFLAAVRPRRSQFADASRARDSRGPALPEGPRSAARTWTSRTFEDPKAASSHRARAVAAHQRESDLRRRVTRIRIQSVWAREIRRRRPVPAPRTARRSMRAARSTAAAFTDASGLGQAAPRQPGAQDPASSIGCTPTASDARSRPTENRCSKHQRASTRRAIDSTRCFAHDVLRQFVLRGPAATGGLRESADRSTEDSACWLKLKA